MEFHNLKWDVGERVRECRLRAGYTQAQCAEIMDISINFLSEIENGKKGMSQETIYKFCKNLEISADYILFGSQHSKLPNNLIATVNTLSDEELVILSDYIIALKNMRKI